MTRAGFGRADITAYDRGVALFGYGTPGNVALGVAMPLHARALVVEEAATRRRVAYVCLELGLVSEALRRAIVDALSPSVDGLDGDAVMITATHTHSGPNGFSDYLFYAATAPGFSRRVCDAIAQGAVAAVREAIARLRPARLTLHAGAMPLDEPVAFNRAMRAWASNPEAQSQRGARPDEAVDRTMTLLRVDALDAGPMGAVSWFATHGTSIKSESARIHPDNKGVAAADCEARARAAYGASDFVAIFAQGAAGDVSPCSRWSPTRRRMLGAHDDDQRSVEAAGLSQSRLAWRLFEEAPAAGRLLEGPVRGALHRDDFARAPVDADLAGGLRGCTTTPGVLGLAFAEGTLDGPGPLLALAPLRRALVAVQSLRARSRSASHTAQMQGPKVPWYDVGLGIRGHAFGVLPAAPSALQHVPEARVRYFYQAATGAQRARPWVPHVLPTQALQIGELAIVGVPVEPTTVAGARLRATALASMRAAGVTAAVINGYANAYASYLVTPEEYEHQHYEAACTLFGRHTLGAFQTALRRLGATITGG